MHPLSETPKPPSTMIQSTSAARDGNSAPHGALLRRISIPAADIVARSPTGPVGKCWLAGAGCNPAAAVAVSVKVTFVAVVPGITGSWLNKAVIPLGSPEATNWTGLANPLLVGVIKMVTGVGVPGTTYAVEGGPATEKESIVKLPAAEAPPPGVGVFTDTLTSPPGDISEAGMTAASWVALTKVVVSVLPLKLTVDVETNPEPFTVRVKAAPAGACVGVRLLIEGAGLLTVIVSGGLITLPSVAVIWEVPVLTPVAAPVLAPMVATDVVAEIQVTPEVMVCVELSL